MKIALIGYGKMGKEIEKIAISECHQIVCRVDETNIESGFEKLPGADVAIEFSGPVSAYENVLKCFSLRIPVVCGSTGWNAQLELARQKCLKENQSFFYASNFSIGVHIMLKLNEKLADLMKDRYNYTLTIEETHHLQKKDFPSGTAISIAEGIIIHSEKKNWDAQLENPVHNPDKETISILSKREDGVPGTHKVKYTSEIDTIELIHTAHSRKGFAEGAFKAALWIVGKAGFFGMDDMINDK
jgi:4-hydroxy-tetrahydrodipicolinate reductase